MQGIVCSFRLIMSHACNDSLFIHVIIHTCERRLLYCMMTICFISTGRSVFFPFVSSRDVANGSQTPTRWNLYSSSQRGWRTEEGRRWRAGGEDKTRKEGKERKVGEGEEEGRISMAEADRFTVDC